MSGRSSQRKGREGERQLARLLQEHGFNAVVGDPLNYGTQPDLTGIPGVHIEAKRCEHIRLSEWMEQAIRDSQRFGDGIPIVFHRRSREDWLCTMRMEDFIKMYQMRGIRHDTNTESGIDKAATCGAEAGTL